MTRFLLFSLLCFLAAKSVCSQTFPRVSFAGQTLANHSYVNLSAVGSDASNSVQCVTDLETCCSGSIHVGEWYSPDGSSLPLRFLGDIFQDPNVDQRVTLGRENNAAEPVGLYRCEIPTNNVNDVTDNSIRDVVYVGLYTATGGS